MGSCLLLTTSSLKISGGFLFWKFCHIMGYINYYYLECSYSCTLLCCCSCSHWFLGFWKIMWNIVCSKDFGNPVHILLITSLIVQRTSWYGGENFKGELFLLNSTKFPILSKAGTRLTHRRERSLFTNERGLCLILNSIPFVNWVNFVLCYETFFPRYSDFLLLTKKQLNWKELA